MLRIETNIKEYEVIKKRKMQVNDSLIKVKINNKEYNGLFRNEQIYPDSFYVMSGYCKPTTTKWIIKMQDIIEERMVYEILMDSKIIKIYINDNPIECYCSVDVEKEKGTNVGYINFIEY